MLADMETLCPRRGDLNGIRAGVAGLETVAMKENVATVSFMENKRPALDPSQAADALAAIDRDQRAVRDTPWPLWLYPVNTVLLVALGLSFLAPERALWVTLLIVLAVVGANLLAGRVNGAPFALPTSRAFLGLVAVSGFLLVASHAAARELDTALGNVALSLAAGATYAVACWVHHRSTRGEGAR